MASNDRINENGWIIEVKEGLGIEEEEEEKELRVSVFNVPKELLAMKSEAYIPQCLSIGPYHHWRPELYDMKRHKLTVARRFQKRIKDLGSFESVVVKEIKERDWQIRSCYHKFIDYNEETLSWLMALDAAFLLECLQFYVRHHNDQTSHSDVKHLGRILDPKAASAVHNSIVRDLMMLENQVPVFLLQKLLELQLGSRANSEKRLSRFRRLKQQQRMESQLEFTKSAILTPYNYFEWKPKIQLHLRIRGLFRITMETEVEPTSAIEKSRYLNRMEEAFGILCLSISPELLFHVESCSTPNEIWKTLERLFGEQDEIWQSFLFSLAHTKDPQTYAEVDGHPQWEATMDEEFFSPFFNGNLLRSSALASSKLLFENIEVQKSSSIFAADSSPVSKFAEKKTGDPIKVEPEIEFGTLTGLKSVEAMSPAGGLSSLASEPNVAISKPLKIESSSIKEGDGLSLSTPDKQSRKVIHDSVFPVSIQRKSNNSDCRRPATGTERAPPVHAVIQFESRGISHNDLSRPLEKQVSEDVVLPDGTAVKKDLPTSLNPTSNPVTATILDRCLRSVTQADWLVANSFQGLKRRTEEALRDKLRVYCVGPLLPSAHLDPSDPRDSIVGTSSRVEMDCAQWLDGKPPKSVIYVSFGSLISVSARQIEEIRMGLKEIAVRAWDEAILNLTLLGLAETSITGSIPSSFGSLKKLQTLKLYTAELSGSIPAEIGDCVALENLYLYGNKLSGSIPRELGKLQNLQNLYLWHNNLVGSMPPELGNCSALTVIDFSNNTLTGSIPTSFGNLKNLASLEFSDNMISGSIPAALVNCSFLSQFIVDNNQLSEANPCVWSCPSSRQMADIFTHTFTEQKFPFLRDRLGVKDTTA